MCGRFALDIPRKRLQERLELSEIPEVPPRYNIAPGQLVEAVVQTPELRELRIFSGAGSFVGQGHLHRPPDDQRPSRGRCREASVQGTMRCRRCLIPAQGFYEWSRTEGKGQPWLITSRTEEVLALAGIWEHCESPDGEIIERMATLTCSANDLISPLHDRMPVIVRSADDARWLDPKTIRPKGLMDIQLPRQWPDMRVFRIRTLVNSPRNDDASLIEPLG